MNPYAPDRPANPKLDPAKQQAAQAKAILLASDGAVVGSISKSLQSDGVDAINAERIAIDAVVYRSRVERMHGVCMMLSGLALIAISYLLFCYRFRRIPGYFAMMGVFTLMLGTAKAYQRSKIVRAASDGTKLR